MFKLKRILFRRVFAKTFSFLQRKKSIPQLLDELRDKQYILFIWKANAKNGDQNAVKRIGEINFEIAQIKLDIFRQTKCIHKTKQLIEA